MRLVIMLRARQQMAAIVANQEPRSGEKEQNDDHGEGHDRKEVGVFGLSGIRVGGSWVHLLLDAIGMDGDGRTINAEASGS